jgi:uronate dehydrogenase
MDVRRLAIWISPRDFAQLVTIGLEHPDIKHEVVFGMSDNVPSWWDNSNALQLGYKPQDRSADYAEKVYANYPVDTGNPLADSLHGGAFVTAEMGGDPSKADID